MHQTGCEQQPSVLCSAICMALCLTSLHTTMPCYVQDVLTAIQEAPYSTNPGKKGMTTGGKATPTRDQVCAGSTSKTTSHMGCNLHMTT